ncbi:MAG: T9SS type A sorting domain-containing protein, partial [Prolixibacteraceae bacterium]|nr:T9SS type A sorting domain-containing protein [Prolixibacteraceae bacterium]
YTPENPIPVNGGAGISLSPVFSWAGGDPNGDDLTYEVYLGTENPPDLVGSVFDNNFTAQNLQHSTLHYWKIVATDGELTSEGPVWSFTTTGIPPQMSICGLSKLSGTSVTICGEVVNDNGANIISRGICYNTEPNPTTNNMIAYPQFNNDIYSCELTGLTPYKHYYYRAFAMSNEGTGYSTQGEFTTMPGLPFVVAGGIENIFRTTASVNGEITHIYDESILERGVVWSVNEGFDVGSANRVSESGNWNMPGNFNFNLGGLPGPARIFFRIFAVNTAGTAYSSEASFETTNTPPFIDLDGDNSSGIQGNDYRGIYTEQLEGGRITDVDILLYDIDNDPIQGLTVTLLNQVHDNEEYLVVEGEFENITVIGNQTDNLAITASGPVNNDEWKTILRAIELRNIHDAPAPEEERQVRVSVNDGYDESALAMAFMNVIPVNDEPVCIAIPSQNRAPVAGETVSVIPGTWDDALDECTGGFEVSYQWQYQDGLGTAFDIEGETNIDLFLNENLCGKSVRVTEIITDSDCGGENIVTTRAESEWAEVVRTSQVIVFDPLPVHYMHEKAFPFEGSSSSGLPVEYNSVNENILKVSGDTAYLMAAGRVIVSCFQPGNMCYLPSAKIDRLATIAKGNQQVENYSDLNLSYPDRQVILPAKASSGLPLTALSSDTLIVSTLKDTLILNKTGLVDLQLFQPGNANYHPSDTVVVSVVVDKGQQVITANYPPMSYGEGPYPIDVFSSSGLPVKLECLENEKLEYPADSFIVLGTGDVTITATQEGNELWYPAEPDVQTISIQKGNQIIAFEPIGEKRFNDPVFFAEATVNSGLEILFVISDTTIATINNGIVQIKDVGVTQVQAYNNGNELWEPVSAQQQLEILAAEQLISAGLFDTLTFGDLPFMIDFSATSGLDVLIGIEDEEVAKFNGDKFEVQNAGETNVILSQPGNEQWNPAEPLSRTLVVKKATQTLYSELPDTIENHGQKIFAAVFASSGLPVDLLTEDEQLAGLAGDSIEIRSHGELMLTAIQAGNKNYEPVQGQFRIVINQPVLIDEMEATEFYVYPNPASSYLMVKTGSFQPLPCDAKLINMLGETVMVLTLNNRINSISIDKLASGIYILQIEGHNSVLRKKFVVQN